MSDNEWGYNEQPAQAQGGCVPFKIGNSNDNSTLEVLLISSRRVNGQWVIPKGFVLKKTKETSEMTAIRKAHEEAGIKGLHRKFLGIFDDVETNSRIDVWAFEVVNELSEWPQCKDRTRKWFNLHGILKDKTFKKNVRTAVWLMLKAMKHAYPCSNNNDANQTNLKTEDNLCSICMEKQIDSVLLDCAHSSVCMECTKNLKICPMCRQPIVKAIKIFKT